MEQVNSKINKLSEDSKAKLLEYLIRYDESVYGKKPL